MEQFFQHASQGKACWGYFYRVCDDVHESKRKDDCRNSFAISLETKKRNFSTMKMNGRENRDPHSWVSFSSSSATRTIPQSPGWFPFQLSRSTQLSWTHWAAADLASRLCQRCHTGILLVLIYVLTSPTFTLRVSVKIAVHAQLDHPSLAWPSFFWTEFPTHFWTKHGCLPTNQLYTFFTLRSLVINFAFGV